MSVPVDYRMDSKLLEAVSQGHRDHTHMERYLRIRRFCYGRVLDFGCGSGYGTKLLAENPNVGEAVGFDVDQVMIDFASAHHWHGGARSPAYLSGMGQNVELRDGVPHFVGPLTQPFDTVVALEVIEHMDDIEALLRFSGNAQLLITSFPDQPTKHFNPCHVRDLVRQDVIDYFSLDHVPWKGFRVGDVQILMFLRRPEGMPEALARNILDL